MQSLKVILLLVLVNLTLFANGQTKVILKRQLCDTCLINFDTIYRESNKSFKMDNNSEFITLQKNLWKSFFIRYDCSTNKTHTWSPSIVDTTKMRLRCEKSVNEILKNVNSYLAIQANSDSTFILDFYSFEDEYFVKKDIHYVDTCFILSFGNDFTAINYRQNLGKLNALDWTPWFDLFRPNELGCHSVFLITENDKTYLINWKSDD